MSLISHFIGRIGRKSPKLFCFSTDAKKVITPTFTYQLNEIKDRKDIVQPRVSLLIEIPNSPGSLHELLRYFWKYDVDITHIESRPTPRGSDSFLIYIDYEGNSDDESTKLIVKDLQKHTRNILILAEKEVSWFPRHVSDLDHIANRTLDAGEHLSCDHPGFHDKVYRARRSELADIAKSHRFDKPLTNVKYTSEEITTWGVVYDRLRQIQEQYACKEYLSILRKLEDQCGYGKNSIPQFQDISNFLDRSTGFRLRPVTGLLSSRDFLNALAFRVFFSTQYIRHSSKPLYTPEPDICHELLGHAPMFADPDFANFSQEIGLASLGASDHDIKRLATCYWHSVEFGLLRENDSLGKKVIKAYGAGLLSSFGELEYACGNPDSQAFNRPTLKDWNPDIAAETEYPITTYQPVYFVAESLLDAKDKMRHFCERLSKPFHARYNSLTKSIWVDRAIKTSTLHVNKV